MDARERQLHVIDSRMNSGASAWMHEVFLCLFVVSAFINQKEHENSSAVNILEFDKVIRSISKLLVNYLY